MPVPFLGGCLCKAIRYEVAAEPLAVMNCHCRDCQYASGGGFTTAVVVPRAAFKLLKGTPKTFATVGENGKAVSVISAATAARRCSVSRPMKRSGS